MVSQPERCANCQTALIGAWCHVCGQKRFVEADRRFGHLLGQFVEAVTDLDSRFWRSLRALVFRPGLLSREYIEGRRARWLSLVTLFVVVSVAFFVAPFHGGDFALQFEQHVSGRLRVLASEPGTEPSAGQRAATGQSHTPFTEPWIDARVRQRAAAARAASGGARSYDYRDYRRDYDARADEVSKALVVLHVPLTALALMLLFAPRRRYFAEHFVVALHYFAFALVLLQVLVHGNALMSAVLPEAWQPPFVVLDWIVRTVLPLYAVFALQRAYRVGWLWATVAAVGMLAAALATNLYVYRTVQFLVTFALT